MRDDNISKILDATLARVAFNLKKQHISHSYKDYIALEILQEEGSMAHYALSTKLKEWELLQIPIRIERLIKVQPQNERNEPDEFLISYRKKLIDKNVASRNISTIHALCDIVSDTTTATSQVLAQFGINTHTITSIIREAGDKAEGMQSDIRYHILDMDSQPKDSVSSTTLLEQYSTDLTRQAREGKIDPVIGREAEIERVVQILSRRKKNNPILIGEAGVGKSAIVEGLALRIVSNHAPTTIRGKSIYSLDVAALVAGTKFRGEFEERMQQLLDELRRTDNAIIFIDEIHTIVGAGATQGNLDTANILKPALARGEIQAIGATTFDEYRENIESDPALARRFQKVVIEPPTVNQTLEILHQIAPYYEQYHNVRYTDKALRSCVMLTERYITDRHFPDKAIDIMDEAGARSRILSSHKPTAIQHTEKQLHKARAERHEAITALKYENVATAHLKEIALKTRLMEQRAAWHHTMRENPTLIDEADIAQMITSITGIPAEHISNSEAERLRTLAEYLQRRVIGQSEAVNSIARSLQRSRAGLKDKERPIGVFLFIGPTGVGKTLLAKELSRCLFDKQRGLIRLDMSEYGERHSIARLIGSPPGYVGYGEGGQLTEAVRRQPYAVVLFDEIEKAHSDVLNSMLQIFDEGHLTDGNGRKVDFRNTIIILTSNVGSRAATEQRQLVGYNTRSKQHNDDITPHKEYRKALERGFTPEFLNRIDDIIYFRTLSAEDVEQIIDLELDQILQRALELGYRVEVTREAKQRLASMGYEVHYGVRALKRTLIDKVEEPLSALIIDGELVAGGSVTIDSNTEQEITLSVA